MTRNIEAMKAFYRDVLGLEEVDVRDIPADFLRKLGVAKGGARLHVLGFGEIVRNAVAYFDKAPLKNERIVIRLGICALQYSWQFWWSPSSYVAVSRYLRS